MNQRKFPPPSTDTEIISLERQLAQKLVKNGIVDVVVRVVRKRGGLKEYHLVGPPECVARAKRFLDKET